MLYSWITILYRKNNKLVRLSLSKFVDHGVKDKKASRLYEIQHYIVYDMSWK